MNETVRLYGVPVPTAQYTELEKLAKIVFGYFDVRVDDKTAGREAVRIATRVNEHIRTLVAVSEAKAQVARNRAAIRKIKP